MTANKINFRFCLVRDRLTHHPGLNRQSSADSATLHTNLGCDWCRNMHRIDAFLRRKLPFYSVVLRVKMAASSIQCDFDEALEFAKECVNINFELKEKQIQTLKSLYEGMIQWQVYPLGLVKILYFSSFPSCFRGNSVNSNP